MMPYSICPKYSVDAGSGKRQYNPGERCRHNGVIIAGWMGAVQSGQHFRQCWIDDMKENGMGEQEAMDWSKGGKTMQLMGRKVDLGGESASEFALVFGRTIARLERWLSEQKGI
jgi:hypothetical protein